MNSNMNDEEFIAYAESVCFDNPWTPDSVRAALGSEYAVFAVERGDSGEGIGYAVGRVSFDEAELHRIAVLPEHRRGGGGGGGGGGRASQRSARSAERKGYSSKYVRGMSPPSRSTRSTDSRGSPSAAATTVTTTRSCTN